MRIKIEVDLKVRGYWQKTEAIEISENEILSFVEEDVKKRYDCEPELIKTKSRIISIELP